MKLLDIKARPSLKAIREYNDNAFKILECPCGALNRFWTMEKHMVLFCEYEQKEKELMKEKSKKLNEIATLNN
jgi:hypothetical protein